MDNCTLDLDFSCFKVNIIPLKAKDFFKPQSSITEKGDDASLSSRKAVHVLANMLHQFGRDCLVMIAFVRVDEQPLGLNGILRNDLILDGTIKSRANDVLNFEDRLSGI